MYHVKWIFQFILYTLTAKVYGYYHEPPINLITSSTYAVLRNDSFFGYSVTYQPQMRSLVISAPRADNIGQVFIYDIEQNNLTKVDFDIERNTSSTTDYWLGATVKAGSYFFTTCAPRYVKTQVKGNLSGTFSRCFVKTIPQGMQVMHPMTQSDQEFGANIFEQTMDSFGWSIDITPHNNVLIGGPAMLRGRVIQYTNISESPMLISSPGTGKSTQLDSFNFGYSIASGNFYSDLENEVTYAISTPYGDTGVGQVLFYSEDGKYINSLKDEESGLGTIFGAALCTVKLDGKRASLFVGAPAYLPDGDNGVDLGAVHIYMPDDNTLSLKTTIRGHDFGGRFGHAIVNIGDLDSDGKDDVAISAPYEDNGDGAVYIYTANNILTISQEIVYTQRIKQTSFRAFGLSMSTLQDYDDNGCKELAIGAPESNAVAVYSCFSSVIVNVFSILPNLQNRNFTEKEKFTFQSCLNVTYPEKPENIIATVSVKIALTHPSAKLEMSKNEVFMYKQSLSDKKNVYCRDVVVLTPLDKYVESNSIQIIVNAQLEDDPRLSKNFNPQRVILSGRSSLSVSSIIWAAGCYSSICVPILHTSIITSMANPYMIGSSDAENVSITLTNSGETAYSACVRVRVGGVRVLQAPGCRRDKEGSLICEPRNPLRTNQTWNTDIIELETASLTSQGRKINIYVDRYNHCESKTEKKSYEKVINLKTDTSGLTLMREAIPDEIVKISFGNMETEISHLYTIINNGITNWEKISCRIIQNNSYVKTRNPLSIYKKPVKRDNNLNMKTEEAACNDTVCDIGDVWKNQKIYIMVTLQIQPMPVDVFYINKNVTVATYFHLLLNYETMSESVNSTLVRLETPEVAIWIYICAGVVALLILLIVIIIFYKCGFLQRKNKEKLQGLKENVKRQSMRRTMLLRESMRASQNKTEDHRNKLLNNGEDIGEGDKDIDVAPTKNNPEE